MRAVGMVALTMVLAVCAPADLPTAPDAEVEEVAFPVAYSVATCDVNVAAITAKVKSYYAMSGPRWSWWRTIYGLEPPDPPAFKDGYTVDDYVAWKAVDPANRAGPMTSESAQARAVNWAYWGTVAKALACVEAENEGKQDSGTGQSELTWTATPATATITEGASGTLSFRVTPSDTTSAGGCRMNGYVAVSGAPTGVTLTGDAVNAGAHGSLGWADHVCWNVRTNGPREYRVAYSSASDGVLTTFGDAILTYYDIHSGDTTAVQIATISVTDDGVISKFRTTYTNGARVLTTVPVTPLTFEEGKRSRLRIAVRGDPGENGVRLITRRCENAPGAALCTFPQTSGDLHDLEEFGWSFSDDERCDDYPSTSCIYANEYIGWTKFGQDYYYEFSLYTTDDNSVGKDERVQFCPESTLADPGCIVLTVTEDDLLQIFLKKNGSNVEVRAYRDYFKPIIVTLTASGGAQVNGGATHTVTLAQNEGSRSIVRAPYTCTGGAGWITATHPQGTTDKEQVCR